MCLSQDAAPGASAAQRQIRDQGNNAIPCPVNCNDVSGKWADPESGGTWTLNQTGDKITGSLTMSKTECGSVTWQVVGRISDGVATLTATLPSPSVDKCGVAAAASINATRTPYCNTTGQRKVEPRK